MYIIQNIHCKHGKIHSAGLSQFSRVSLKFFHGYKHHSLIILNNKQSWLKKYESSSTENSMGLKPWMFTPANISISTVTQPDGEKFYGLASCPISAWGHVIYNAILFENGKLFSNQWRPLSAYNYHKNCRCLLIFIPQDIWEKQLNDTFGNLKFQLPQNLPFYAKTYAVGTYVE